MAEPLLQALLFVASGGLTVRRRRAARARKLVADLRARCEARGGACDCGMHRRPRA